jgi:protein-disulfide isomerase/FKBP-type peptidyl-prolyl cis-trans isomerase
MRFPPIAPVVTAALALAHCAPAPQSAPPQTVVIAPPAPAPEAPSSASPPAPADGADLPSEADAAVPILPIDPAWGDRTALVTIVMFGDFQCPYTARSTKTIRALEDKYGATDLRVVWKNDPLPFHPHAREAAEAAEAVQMLAGSEAFWKFHDEVFANQARLDPTVFETWAQTAGVNVPSFRQLVLAHAGGAKVDADVALAKKLGVGGTPAFFVNGVSVTGAQPEEKFSAIIDAEMAKAKGRVAEGTSPALLYAAMAKENYVRPPPETVAPTPPADTTTVWKVALAGAPARGSDAALVTIVEFADFQCPFCRRVEPTLVTIRATYGDKVRLVWKDAPLPFHTRAYPAAELAREARAEKGLAGFWVAHDALLASPKLEDADLAGIAAAGGLDPTKAHDAVASERRKADIDKDAAQGKDIEATGIPTFFINGRKLVGAQPLEKFKSMIDEEIVHAQAALAKGTPRAGLYDALVAGGRGVQPAGTLGIKDLVVGIGAAVKSGDQVTVQYVGTLDDGTVFDDSRKHGRPFVFTVGEGRVIKGWDQGIPGMRVGGRRRLSIPAALGYGSRSVGSIPANANLTFEVELISSP